MDRRTFLGTAAAVVGASAQRSVAADTPVKSDIDSLQRVLVLRPCLAAWWPIPEEDAARAVLFGDERYTEEAAHDMWNEGVVQHRKLLDLLRTSEVEVVQLDQVLDEAIARSRAAGRFDAWVAKTLPALADDADHVTAEVLLESAPYPLEPGNADEPDVLPLRWAFYTRDIAAMTPRGLVLSRFINQDRLPEPTLMRLALDWSPTLRRIPVAFDATQAKVNLQGGDFVVADDRTVFLGVGSLTDPAAAPKLARALNMDVVTVQLPPESNARKWYGLRKLFLHLDTAFGLLDAKTALTVPYVFEAKFAQGKPLEQMARACRKLASIDQVDFRKTIRVLRDLGRVRRFVAGSGERDASVEGMKLVDYLRSLKYRLVFVGGDPPKDFDGEFFRERLLPELRAQAANVVALGPGTVIAYSENARTLHAVRAAGIDVKTFPGSALARWHGGPHCLTLPLERT